MSDHSSKAVILWAAIANTGIGVAKFFGAWLTGSAAMLSEAIHSMVDVSNQLLLLVGLRIAAKPPTEKRPSGHSRIMYVFSLFVALILFGMGAVYTGIETWHKLHEPNEVASFFHTMVAVGILIFGILLEGKSWWVAFMAFKSENANGTILQGLVSLRDPSVLVILLEDTAAILGLIVAGLTLPSSPGFFGTVEYCFVIGLAVVGVEANVAISVAIFYHVPI
ncbi:MAG: cation transporter, partial [Alphaproteobacteria bacterium]|nr:cation transporter [Alphaproteobacteria bacterium]